MGAGVHACAGAGAGAGLCEVHLVWDCNAQFVPGATKWSTERDMRGLRGTSVQIGCGRNGGVEVGVGDVDKGVLSATKLEDSTLCENQKIDAHLGRGSKKPRSEVPM